MTSSKREGDGATPIIVTKALYGFYRKDKGPKPNSQLAFLPIQQHWGWCDDAGHPNYNRLVSKPFGASHEELWRQDALYDLVVVLDINITHRIRGKGSALFMHVARDGFLPTEGCIALEKRDLYRLLTIMDSDTKIIIQP